MVTPHMVPLYRLELVREKDIPYRSVARIEAAAEVFHEMLDSAHVEKMAMLHCNSGGDLIGAEIAAVGSLERVGTTMSDLFKGAIRNNAASVWLAHNHVDGRVKASLPDYQYTLKAITASALLDIPLEDHLVIGPGSYYSIRQNTRELEDELIHSEKEMIRKSLLGMLPVPNLKKPFR